MPFADQLRSLWRDIPARLSRSARPGWFGRKWKSPQGVNLAGFCVSHASGYLQVTGAHDSVSR